METQLYDLGCSKTKFLSHKLLIEWDMDAGLKIDAYMNDWMCFPI